MIAISGPTGTRIAMDIYRIRRTSIPKASNTTAAAKLAMPKVAILGLTKRRCRVSVDDVRCTL